MNPAVIRLVVLVCTFGCAPRYASSQDAPRALWDALLKGDGGKEIEGFLRYPEHQANPTAAVRTEGRSDLWTSIE